MILHMNDKVVFAGERLGADFAHEVALIEVVFAVFAYSVAHQMVLKMSLLYKDLTAEMAGSGTVMILLVFEHCSNGLAECVTLVALHLPLDAMHRVQVTRVIEGTL